MLFTVLVQRQNRSGHETKIPGLSILPESCLRATLSVSDFTNRPPYFRRIVLAGQIARSVINITGFIYKILHANNSLVVLLLFHDIFNLFFEHCEPLVHVLFRLGAEVVRPAARLDGDYVHSVRDYCLVYFGTVEVYHSQGNKPRLKSIEVSSIRAKYAEQRAFGDSE